MLLFELAIDTDTGRMDGDGARGWLCGIFIGDEYAMLATCRVICLGVVIEAMHARGIRIVRATLSSVEEFMHAAAPST